MPDSETFQNNSVKLINYTEILIVILYALEYQLWILNPEVQGSNPGLHTWVA